MPSPRPMFDHATGYPINDRQEISYHRGGLVYSIRNALSEQLPEMSTGSAAVMGTHKESPVKLTKFDIMGGI